MKDTTFKPGHNEWTKGSQLDRFGSASLPDLPRHSHRARR